MLLPFSSVLCSSAPLLSLSLSHSLLSVRLCARKSKTLHSYITQKLESLAEASEERRQAQRGNKRKKTDSDTTDSVEPTKQGRGKKATSKNKGKERLKPGQEAGEEEEEGGRGVNSIGYASPLLSDEDEFV
ncbi:Transcriptional coactivator YAP1-like [Balamuthia mandrillaris]